MTIEQAGTRNLSADRMNEVLQEAAKLIGSIDDLGRRFLVFRHDPTRFPAPIAQTEPGNRAEEQFR